MQFVWNVGMCDEYIASWLCHICLASFPGLPPFFVLLFAFSIITRKQKNGAPLPLPCTKCKPTNKKGGGLGTKLTFAIKGMHSI